MSDESDPRDADLAFVDFDLYTEPPARMHRRPIKALRLGHPMTKRARQWVLVLGR